MPPRARAKPATGLAGFAASDSEPDLDAFDKSELQAVARTMSTTKKPRGRPPGTASKVTKTAPRTARRTSSDRLLAVPESTEPSATATKKNSGVSKATRKAQQIAHDETVTFDDIPATVPATDTKKGTRGRPKNSNGDTSIIAPQSTVKRRGRPPRQPATLVEEVPETQQADMMELDAVLEEEEEEEEEDGEELENQDMDVASASAALESWAEYDTNDVSLRRRVGDLAKKYETLEARHRDLREIGVREAEQNFARLKKQAEERTAAATQLITELKAELAAQTALAREGEELRKQLEASEAKTQNLEVTIQDLNKSLSGAKTEIKTLSTKLAAVRSGDSNPRVPGSAIKTGGPANRTAQAEAAHASQAIAQAKEDLYADLTDLIIRGVKQEEVENTFDCIQTGRNGTLHFKLAVENDSSLDDIHFTYQPQLDAGRDQEMIEMLPEYLTDEIIFPRSQAPKFYSRVNKSLTEDLTR
ncbi:chromosome segregation protein Csm1/Pcs1-domain-containing protein [Fusarium tricinctum]|uniref:Chromosome segregation protein Csm1/Pcs1-domain-containing protein n=1 Tax=Fusarium tricinctum TaxID=61284 RepID=A0A8K0RVA6_9HYPO|nr:chromosome segregation protein Csm1/Pcs1-domain-containing protein [Fusarium tricinctum]